MNSSENQTVLLRASQWCYQGLWSVITKWLKVPEQPCAPIGLHDQGSRSFRPSLGFLKYLKFLFWIVLLVIDIFLFVVWLIIILTAPWAVGLLLTPIIWTVMILPDIVAYVAIHLRFDSTWYTLSDRSMRIRRGIWIIRETTITYENIQNVTVTQGPLQRYFGIADVRVGTAGGGASAAHGGSMTGHQGIIEGVDCAEEIRQLVLLKWKQSKSAGLGDDHAHETSKGLSSSWSDGQVELLEQIRDLAVRLAC